MVAVEFEFFIPDAQFVRNFTDGFQVGFLGNFQIAEHECSPCRMGAKVRF